MVRACGEMGLDPDDAFCLKCVQMKELLDIRHCVFLMGPAAAGKSECWRILAKARELMGPGVRYLKTGIWDVNPKAVETQELYGYISMATREWKDGLLSTVMRNIGAIPDELPKWIMLDGDLDANWIESMNFVMSWTITSRMFEVVLPRRLMRESLAEAAHDAHGVCEDSRLEARDAGYCK